MMARMGFSRLETGSTATPNASSAVAPSRHSEPAGGEDHLAGQGIFETLDRQLRLAYEATVAAAVGQEQLSAPQGLDADRVQPVLRYERVECPGIDPEAFGKALGRVSHVGNRHPDLEHTHSAIEDPRPGRVNPSALALDAIDAGQHPVAAYGVS